MTPTAARKSRLKWAGRTSRGRGQCGQVATAARIMTRVEDVSPEEAEQRLTEWAAART